MGQDMSTTNMHRDIASYIAKHYSYMFMCMQLFKTFKC